MKIVELEPNTRKDSNMWQIIVGKTSDGKKEYQVSDGEAYDSTNNFNERTCSYDFTDLMEAKELCNKLNKKGQ